MSNKREYYKAIYLEHKMTVLVLLCKSRDKKQITEMSVPSFETAMKVVIGSITGDSSKPEVRKTFQG